MYTTKTTLINKLANGCEIGWTDFEHTYRPLILSVAAKQLDNGSEVCYFMISNYLSQLRLHC